MLRKVLKVVGGVVLVLALAIAGLLGWVLTHWDRDFSFVAKPAIAASSDPAVIAQGEYVFNVTGHCSGCHTADVIHHTRGDRSAPVGGFVFEAGPFGRFVARNLTPDKETGIGVRSDGELARAIRYGISHDGKYLPFMAMAVGSMADQDLGAAISYIRTLKPVANPVPPESWGLMAKVLASRFQPHDAPPPAYVAAGAEPSAARGAYLALGPADCVGCHSHRDPIRGFAIVGAPFSGGDPDPDESDAALEIAPPNLTPDPSFGHIARWDEDTFVKRFQSGKVFAGSRMPWENFAELTDSDVRSVFRFLRTLPPAPVNNGPTRRMAGWKPGRN